jgi:transposase-like protein
MSREKQHKKMDIADIYERFPDEKACLKHLEEVRWNGKPTCPYCNSSRVTNTLKINRYHCNSCNTSFSVTTRTIFHKTRLDIRLWLVAIFFIFNTNEGISARQLAKVLGVNKNTAHRMLIQIRQTMLENKGSLEAIVA